jgi:leader peptidase (prepilin peptidase)/N-methyltransferase
LLAAGLSLAGLIRWQALFLGMVPGAVLLAAAFATRGGIGGGDALMVLVIGMYLGPWDSFFILMVGLVLVAVYGIFWKICRHISLKRAVCFTPFLGIGFGVWWMLEWIGGGV